MLCLFGNDALVLRIGNSSRPGRNHTNADQFAAVIDQAGLYFPLASVTESPLTRQPLGVFWADFNQVTNALGDVRNFEAETQFGVSVWRLRLTRTTNEITFSYPAADTNLLEIATTQDGFSNHYDRVLWTWCILWGRNYEPYDDLLADGYTFLDPKRLVLDITLGDINDCDTYQYNAGGTSITMSDEEGDDLTPGFGIDGDPCAITNLLQRFSFTAIQRNTNLSTTVTWESCPIFRYILLSADALATNTIWQPQAYVWGQPGASATSWTDPTTTNSAVVTQRFYSVEKILGNTIAAGGFHGLALLTNSTLWAWGQDSLHQLGDNSANDEAAPESLTDSLCGPARLTNAVALAGGYDYSVAVDAKGVVWSWGEGTLSGQLGNGGNTNVLTPSPINGISNVISVAAGYEHTLALRADGTVWAWGYNHAGDVEGNGNGQLGAGFLGGAASTNSPVRSLVPTGTVIVAIAAGYDFSLALDTTGSVWGFGGNASGQLGTNVSSVGRSASTNLPTLVAGISNVIAIAAGLAHSVAVTADKKLWTWGDNSEGALGRTGSGLVPGLVTALTNQNVVAIAAGYQFTLAVTSNGQVYAFGDNQFGELGTNTFGNPITSGPVPVVGISNAVLVSAHPYGYHSLAVTVNQGTNQYYGWGDNSEGDVGDGGGEDEQYTPALLHFDDVCTTCVQLGTGGVFTAQYTGTLKLYFNDDIAAYDDNSGSYTATVNGLATNVTVMATNGQGVVVGTVTKGSNYTYSASGYCNNGPGFPFVDANGIISNGTTTICENLAGEGLCPTGVCFSLVGRIQ